MKLKDLGHSIQKISKWANYSRIAHHGFLHSLLRHFIQAYARYFNEVGWTIGRISANTHHLRAGLGLRTVLSKLHISLQQIMALGAHLYRVLFISGYYGLDLKISTVLIIFLRYLLHVYAGSYIFLLFSLKDFATMESKAWLLHSVHICSVFSNFWQR